jgi:uncharacterized protein YbaR (Trm112 family)
MIYLNIDEKLTCDKVCRAVQTLLKDGASNGETLVIEVRKTAYIIDETIPKLNHKEIND